VVGFVGQATTRVTQVVPSRGDLARADQDEHDHGEDQEVPRRKEALEHGARLRHGRGVGDVSTRVAGVHTGFVETIGAPELIIVLVVVLLVFGSKKVPELPRSLGESMKEFRKGTRDGGEDDRKGG
jgi:sec-independent protein translocase protein TatA